VECEGKGKGRRKNAFLSFKFGVGFLLDGFVDKPATLGYVTECMNFAIHWLV